MTRALDGGRCPQCAGREGQGFNARVWTKAGDAAPVLRGSASCYDGHGRCVRCGARARDIVIRFPGTGRLGQEEAR